MLQATNARGSQDVEHIFHVFPDIDIECDMPDTP